MPEGEDIERVRRILGKVLPSPYVALSKRNLLYQIVLNPDLRPTANLRAPKRGQSAFQTDLCVFRRHQDGTLTPKVAIEFKMGVTTHDVITYSSKALRHKQVYPYLRYGMLATEEKTVPGRFLLHNQGLDFFWPLWEREADLQVILSKKVLSEVEMSNLLERAIFDRERLYSFSLDIDASKL